MVKKDEISEQQRKRLLVLLHELQVKVLKTLHHAIELRFGRQNRGAKVKRAPDVDKTRMKSTTSMRTS
jgi:hypothetical protein